MQLLFFIIFLSLECTLNYLASLTVIPYFLRQFTQLPSLALNCQWQKFFFLILRIFPQDTINIFTIKFELYRKIKFSIFSTQVLLLLLLLFCVCLLVCYFHISSIFIGYHIEVYYFFPNDLANFYIWL